VLRQNVSRAVRFLRRRAGWSQAELGRRARLSRETVSRLERGALESLTFGSVSRVADSLGATPSIELRWHGERLDRLMDAAHARVQESAIGGLRAAGWRAEVEVSFNFYGDRGRYDALAYFPPTGTLLVVEVKIRIGDVQDMLGRLDVKTRLAPQAAHRLGWPKPSRVVPCLVIAEGTSARRVVAQHAALFARFSLQGHAARRWLAGPSDDHVSGILLFERLPNSRQRRQRRELPPSPDPNVQHG